MPAKPKSDRKIRKQVTLDDESIARLERIQDRHAGIQGLSAAIRHAAQFTDAKETTTPTQGERR